MSNAGTSAPWETIRSGLRFLAVAWGVDIGFSVLNRIAWTAAGVLFTNSTTRGKWLMTLIGVLGSTLAFAAAGVALAVAASRLTRFPLVLREGTPADSYRGARDAGSVVDPGLDRAALVVVVALAAMAGFGPASYAVSLVISPAYVNDRPVFGVAEVLWTLDIASSLVAGVVFTIWAARAALVVSRPLAPVLQIASFLGFALYAGFEYWEIITCREKGHPTWARWLELPLEIGTKGVLIALALGVVAAIRDQPRSEGA